MFVRYKKNRSGTTSVVVVDKSSGRFKEVTTIGVSDDPKEIDRLKECGRLWIRQHRLGREPELDLFGDESLSVESENRKVEYVLKHITNVSLNGVDLILSRVFRKVGFDAINDEVFRHLVISRLSCPSSKAATVEYLKNYYNEDINLSRIYRYLDRLNDHYKEKVQDISVAHTLSLSAGHIGVMFYDVTTLYFETDREDELRKTGFSKEGRHHNPQIILGILVNRDGYPLAYTIHGGNKYEGRTMLPVIEEFVKKYRLEDFIVVADSGLMNGDNVADLERLGYKYILGARIKTETREVCDAILSWPKEDRKMFEIPKGGGRRLLIGYTDDRAKKDAYNREKGVRRLERAYRSGRLTKSNINKRGYNKFLEVSSDVDVKINYDKIQEDEKWDGLKGYLTNTQMPPEDVYAAYHSLWNVEMAFRIAKSKLEIRPMFHFTRKRIEAHICICFVALKVYKELDRILKTANIGMSVDKVINLAKTVTTITITLPNGVTHVKTMLLDRHKRIAPLFDDDF
ncbi:MAG: IS1634 family transposase, partial [Paludibacteraceae bacterium]|nr:IS1634 family transposase [Paludibacteraceae bacterium]